MAARNALSKHLYVYSGSSLAPTDSTFNLEPADWNNDNSDDIFAIKQSITGSGNTEVFV